MVVLRRQWECTLESHNFFIAAIYYHVQDQSRKKYMGGGFHTKYIKALIQQYKILFNLAHDGILTADNFYLGSSGLDCVKHGAVKVVAGAQDSLDP